MPLCTRSGKKAMADLWMRMKLREGTSGTSSALLRLARTVSCHQDQRRQNPVRAYPALTNRVRQALKLAAMSLSRNGSALGAFYRRLCARMDKPRANTAVAHKLARMIYFMLTRGETFVDQGQQQYEEQQRQRSIAALRRRAANLGFAITPTTAST
jgi:hypothetical protein